MDMRGSGPGQARRGAAEGALAARAGAAPPRPRAGRGFTLIETAMATVILGVGVVAIIEAQQSFMFTNEWSSHAATATLLANEIREMTRRLPRHDPVTSLFVATDGGGAPVVIGWGVETGEVVVTDFDDVDDFDGLRFGADGDLPGPISASGDIVPEIRADGTVILQDPGDPGSPVAPLQGWSQTVTVQKVDPFNYALVRAPGYSQPAVGGFRGLGANEFPLRVTVAVDYQGPFDSEPREVTRVSWVVP